MHPVRVLMAVLLAKEAAAATVHPADLVPVAGAPVVVLEVRAVGEAEGGSSFVVRRFANSVSRKLTASTIKTSGYCQDLSPRPARSCLAG
jgi:hypothetical protein